jgi:hypothetical protein
MIRKTIILIGILSVALFIATDKVDAATFNLIPERTEVGIGDDIVMDVRIDSEGIGINAAQATISFPSSILEIKNISRQGSIFSFWLEDPSFDNSAGTITFIGGSTSGFSGQALEVFRISFGVKGGGTALVSVSDGAITASDGSGTNVLSATQGVSVQSTPVVTPPVTQIVRPAVPAVVLPIRPQITIPLFPDADKWYSVTTGFIAEWSLPLDVTDVATSIDKVPSSEPPRSEGLFDSKIFSPLSDGVWYLHVQFKNNNGWGPVAHRKISVDSMPPEAFDIDFSHGLSSDNPTPVVTYGTSDQLSGISEYVLTIGSGNPISTSEPSATLPLQGPGKHVLKVIALDGAGNSAENVVEFEIIPLNSPVITEVSERAYTDEGVVDVKGTSSEGREVILTLRDKAGQVVARTMSDVDEDGNWSAQLEGALRRGIYTVGAVARDERGALSYSSSSQKITVTERPLFTIGSFEVTPTWFYIATIIILIGSFFLGWFSERAAHAQRGRKIIIAKRDVSNAFGAVKKDIDKVLRSKDIPEEAAFRLKKVVEGIEKVEGYVSAGVEEIGKKK